MLGKAGAAQSTGGDRGISGTAAALGLPSLPTKLPSEGHVPQTASPEQHHPGVPVPARGGRGCDPGKNRRV